MKLVSAAHGRTNEAVPAYLADHVDTTRLPNVGPFRHYPAHVRANMCAFAKFWLAVLTEIKNRGVEDACKVVCEGLKGLPESITTTWTHAQVQTCVLHYADLRSYADIVVEFAGRGGERAGEVGIIRGFRAR